MMVCVNKIAAKLHGNRKLLALYIVLCYAKDTDQQILSVLSHRVVDVLCIPSLMQAIDSRDSMAMALYSQCFAWVIKKINSRIRSKEDFKTIGILDIFGFENFEVGFKSLFKWIVWYWCFIALHIFVIFPGAWLLNVTT